MKKNNQSNSLLKYFSKQDTKTVNNSQNSSKDKDKEKDSKEKTKESSSKTQYKQTKEIKHEEPKKQEQNKKQNEQKEEKEKRNFSQDIKNTRSTPIKKVQEQKKEEIKSSKNKMNVENSGTEELSATESLTEPALSENEEKNKSSNQNKGRNVSSDNKQQQAKDVKMNQSQTRSNDNKKVDPKQSSKKPQKKNETDDDDYGINDEEEDLPKNSKQKKLVQGSQKKNKMIVEDDDYEEKEEDKDDKELHKNSKSKRVLVKGGQKQNKMIDEDDYDAEEVDDYVEVKKTTSRTKALEEKNLKKIEENKQKQQVSAKKDKAPPQKDKNSSNGNIDSDILAGQTIVFTGDFDGISRDTMSKIVTDMGAKNTGSVSGKTTLLVHGSVLEDGRPPEQGKKYQTAKQKGTKIMNQSQFSDYLKDLTGKSLEDYANVGQNGSRFDKFAAVPNNNNNNPQTQQKKDSQPSKKILQPLNKPKEATKYDPKSKQQNQQPQMVIHKPPKQEQIWTEKYAPSSINLCIGNQKNYEKMMEWLHDWVEVVIKGNKKQVKNSFFNRAQGVPDNSSNVNAKACLLSGPPGIGKTTSVRLIAKFMGYEIREWNASDERNKKSVNNILGDLKSNSILNLLKKNNTSDQTNNKADDEVEAKTNKKFIILMDEVDGMSSGDRGGNQALIDAIKNTNVPIFCICNDRMNPKIRSLANHCYDIKFIKPAKQDVAKYMKNVCEQEGFKDVEIESLEAISERFGNDLRQTLNFLEMHFKTSKRLQGINSKQLNSGQKDATVMLDAFQASTQLMQSFKFQKMTLRERIELFFIDYDLIPLLVHQNYLDTIKPREDASKNKKNDNFNVKELQNLVDATSSIAQSDLLSKSIRQSGNWSLLPNFAFTSCIYPCDKVCEDKPIYPRFPEWLGKFQTTKKTTRELREFRVSLSKSISGSRFAVKFDYVPFLLKIILSHLKKGKNSDIETVLDYLEYYNIKPQHLKEHLNDLQYPKNDYYGVVSSDIKTKLTKEYNKRYSDSSNKIKTQKKQSKSEPSQGKYDKNLDDVVYSDTEELQLDENGDVVEPQQDEQEKSKIKKQQQKNKQNNKSKAPKTKKPKSKKSGSDSLTEEISEDEDGSNSLNQFIVDDTENDD
ncbi:BRCT domain protein (macronuclear) [Tetrahymena thermophila SB210]|uniref:Replication factor C subunit 1 n=1 Tax=Tetrahymena thermophila (strain SB210) TaxID=312017 RepID=Q22DN2_TETTS|nr:BRCT domain protein [Tetrahymena thermophila SB210]EAR83422.1 BRCT domain protein [Tetrahymena thermophila SB210]|eukprot:XP_001031085.1 BRCT domain protein [Tetrahymena thermophila SB210]